MTTPNLPFKIDYIYGYAYGKAVPQYFNDDEMFNYFYDEEEQDQVFNLQVGESMTFTGVTEQIKVTRMEVQS